MRTRVYTWLAGLLLVMSVCLYVRGKVQANPPAYLVPKYQASYSPVEDMLGQMILELRAIREELAEMKQHIGQQRLATVEQGELLFRNRCAGCHDAEVAEEKGGSTILVDETGSFQPMRYQVRNIKRQIEKDLMPMTGNKFTPQEKQIAYSFLDSLNKGG